MSIDKNKVLAAAESSRDRIIRFCQDLVRFKSVNPVFTDSEPVEEKACQEFIARKLRSLGFVNVDLWEPDPATLREKYLGKPGYTPNRRFENRPNLVARLPGRGGGRSMFLTGHVDVVGADPKTEAWVDDPFGAVIRDGKMFGRGTADMKGGIGSMIMAIDVLQRAGVQLAGDVLVGTVVDEETGGMGMLSLVDRGYRADAGIMTEPTDLQVSLLCRGILWGHIHVRGKSGHIEISQPHWTRGGAVDAFRKGLFIVDVIDRLNTEWALRPDKNHRLLPRPNQVSISMFKAGQHPSSHAENCQITVDVQYLPSESDENGLGGNVKREIEAYVQGFAQADPWLRDHPPEFEWFVDADCAEVPDDHELVSIMLQAAQDVGIRPVKTGMEAHTDMSLLTKVGTPTINFGPGPGSIAHQTNEHVEVEDLIRCTKAIALTLVEWCGGKD